MQLISYLLEFLFPSRASERLVLTATAESFGAHVKTFQYSDTIATLLPYHEPVVRAAILEAKFRGSIRAQQLLGTVLCEYLFALQIEREGLETRPIALVPIPLSAERQKERGYNQCTEIIRFALQPLQQIHLADNILVRTRHTLPQTTLNGDARRKNLLSAFSASHVNPTYTYMVIDDVLTTGTTLETAMSALTNAGATDVLGISLAH